MKKDILCIVGPTASGKTSLAIRIAKAVNGEIICADSRTIYKGMDIGTAKPTVHEQQQVPHHLLDIVSPNEYYSVAQFKKDALDCIASIKEKNKVPIIVGGSGLYINAILYDYAFSNPADLSVRKQLQTKSVDELHDILLERDLPIPTNENNPRHLMRIIEMGAAPPQNNTMRSDAIVIGLRVSKDILLQRVTSRVDAMMRDGLVEEVRSLFDTYDKNTEALKAPGYSAIYAFINGEIDTHEAKQIFIRSDMALAKRQITWFKRNEYIRWFDTASYAYEYCTEYFNS